MIWGRSEKCRRFILFFGVEGYPVPVGSCSRHIRKKVIGGSHGRSPPPHAEVALSVPRCVYGRIGILYAVQAENWDAGPARQAGRKPAELVAKLKAVAALERATEALAQGARSNGATRAASRRGALAPGAWAQARAGIGTRQRSTASAAAAEERV